MNYEKSNLLKLNHSFVFGGGNPLELVTRLVLGYIVDLFCHLSIKLDCFAFARNDVNRCHSDENQNLIMQQIELSDYEILNRVQDDRMFNCHYEDERSESVVIPCKESRSGIV